MNILQINKFYHIHGGADQYFFEVSKILENYSHKVVYFSMHHHLNFSTKWSKNFVNNISYEKLEKRNLLKIISKLIFSSEDKNKISHLLVNFKPHLAHLHSIYHHVSPSVVLELKKRNIPMVQTLEDYHLIAPNYNLFHNSYICEITKPNKFYKAILHKCVKNSYIFSIAEVFEKYLHYWLGWERNYVDYFIAPSKFMRNKLIEYGLASEKIICLPHFVDSKQFKPNYKLGDYIIYFGRLSPEKGINYLLEAMKLLPKIKLKVVGRGSQESELRIMNKELGNKNVEFVGFKVGAELKKLIANSRFTILPSVWYEVFGLSILESFASGKSVIASDIGGIPETVKDKFNGLLFEPGNVDDCAEKISRLWSNPLLCRKMGKNARECVEKKFGPEEHYEKLMNIYKIILEKHKF